MKQILLIALICGAVAFVAGFVVASIMQTGRTAALRVQTPTMTNTISLGENDDKDMGTARLSDCDCPEPVASIASSEIPGNSAGTVALGASEGSGVVEVGEFIEIDDYLNSLDDGTTIEIGEYMEVESSFKYESEEPITVGDYIEVDDALY